MTLVDTINAQALYLLRVVTPGGILPRLRSLGIHLTASSDSHDVRQEGNQYYEDPEGRVLEASKRKASRYFDASYLAILAKAVSGLEELELLGNSKIPIVSFYIVCNSLLISSEGMLASSLQHFRRLHTLILSGPENIYVGQFFLNWLPMDMDTRETGIDPYAPESLKEAMKYLGDGCRTLEQIRISHCIPSAPFESHDETTEILREEVGGKVIDLKVRKGWGRLIGREEEW